MRAAHRTKRNEGEKTSLCRVPFARIVDVAIMSNIPDEISERAGFAGGPLRRPSARKASVQCSSAEPILASSRET
jgi:hypothetical protein